MTTTLTRGPGRPREDHVPTEMDTCPTHGRQEFRFHKAGKNADGSQRYVRRCPPCHNDKVQYYQGLA